MHHVKKFLEFSKDKELNENAVKYYVQKEIKNKEIWIVAMK